MARAGGSESDRVLVEGVSWPYFDVVGAEFAEGRPFTELEARAGARVAVLGRQRRRALFGAEPAVGRTLTLAGETLGGGRRARRRARAASSARTATTT